MGTAIVGVMSTGDFHGRDKRKTVDLYCKLCQANALVPPALAFVFDQECLKETEMYDLRRLVGGLVRFLPRRMYENYLLDAKTISAVAKTIEGFCTRTITENRVQSLISAKQTDASYYCEHAQVMPGDWCTHIDGARVLKEIFSELSENRVAYDKLIHSVALTGWILQNSPDAFRSLSEFLLALL